MVITYVGHIAAYRRTCSPGWLAWSEGRQPRGAGTGLHSSDELSQWLSHDDSTINIVIRYYYYYYYYYYYFFYNYYYYHVWIWYIAGIAGCVATVLHDAIMTPADGMYSTT